MLIVSVLSALNVFATLIIREPEDGLEAQIVEDENVQVSNIDNFLFDSNSNLGMTSPLARRKKSRDWSDDDCSFRI